MKEGWKENGSETYSYILLSDICFVCHIILEMERIGFEHKPW